MWIARNKTTGKEYPLTDEQKAAYESGAHTRGKYAFKKAEVVAPPKGVMKSEPIKKGAVDPDQGV